MVLKRDVLKLCVYGQDSGVAGDWAAIEAALNPDDTEDIFFVVDGTGGHAFAETLAEHNRNVARWREIEAERARAAEEADSGDGQ